MSQRRFWDTSTVCRLLGQVDNLRVTDNNYFGEQTLVSRCLHFRMLESLAFALRIVCSPVHRASRASHGDDSDPYKLFRRFVFAMMRRTGGRVLEIHGVPFVGGTGERLECVVFNCPSKQLFAERSGIVLGELHGRILAFYKLVPIKPPALISAWLAW